jgi:anti-sigma B factor antagonist
MSASPVAGRAGWNIPRVIHTVVGRRTVLSVAGEIDLHSVGLLADAVDDAVADGALELWLDLSETEFMDSRGLHLLVETQMRLSDLSRRLVVICPRGPVRRLLELAGVAEGLVLYDDRAAAHRAS